MKKQLLIALSVLLAACGGGGSNVPTSGILGPLPQIYAQAAADQAELQAKGKALLAKAVESKEDPDPSQLMELDSKDREIEKKRDEQVVAQVAAMAGKELPFSISAALSVSNPWFQVSGTPKFYAVHEDLLGVACAFTTAIELTGGDYRTYTVYSFYADSKGNPVHYCDKVRPALNAKAASLAVGTPLASQQMGPVAIEREPELWGDFAQIIFCTEAERAQAMITMDEAQKARKEAARAAKEAQ